MACQRRNSRLPNEVEFANHERRGKPPDLRPADRIPEVRSCRARPAIHRRRVIPARVATGTAPKIPPGQASASAHTPAASGGGGLAGLEAMASKPCYAASV